MPLPTLNDVRYGWRRNRWMTRPDLLLWGDLSAVPIDRPIFFLGLQGGGLTVISRMFRRLPEVVTVSGDSTYWTGADEMHVTFGRYLSWQYRLERAAPPPFGKHVGWAYASDALVDRYRLSASDYQEAAGERFRQAIRLSIHLNAREPQRARFLDKSQSYTLKIPLLRRTLQGSRPRFVGWLRNPWAACWRAATGVDLRHLETSLHHRLQVACEHWRNTARCLLAEVGQDDFRLTRIEDVLRDVEPRLRHLMVHCELGWDPNILPKADDVLPLGTKRQRWYPLKTDINAKWLDQPDDVRALVTREVGELAAQLGYLPTGEREWSPIG